MDTDSTVRAALPVQRDTLYDIEDLKRAKKEQTKRPRVWDSDQGAATKTRKIDQKNGNLATLYRPPLELMFRGSFHESKEVAKSQRKWLLLNLQSATEFSSHMLNRDTWGHEILAGMIASNFIFWQVYDDTTEGKKVCGYYNLTGSIPAVLVLDPFTGKKERSWSGMVQPEVLLEDLMPYMDAAPENSVEKPEKPVKPIKVYKRKRTARRKSEEQEAIGALAASMKNMTATGVPTSNDANECKGDDVGTLLSKKLRYLELAEEPKEVDKKLLCSIRIRLPDGRRVQRNFLLTDPVQLLWPCCSSQLDAAEFPSFELTLAIPGASKTLNYEDKLTFEESGLSNSMISVTWDRA
ncbi:hypothetical protein MKW98_026120 [Papaver atlanticum]|uniref:UBX domain-containing protein n=1 Tax=Papaver atlanticum TaxID=357466 RepID=A0AAD4RYI3_9MAGN|nr:hypothetical protein MKW98_026120 [Papaver atlanticum]